MKKFSFIAFLCALALTAAFVGTALAHAKLSSSVPAAGAKLTSAPPKVTLVFDEEVSDQKEDTYFTVADPTGKQVAAGKLDTADVNHKTLSATLPGGLGNGVYTVKWRAVTSDDGGITVGTFTYGVNADPGPQSNVAGEEQEAGATASPTVAATSAATSAATATRAATSAATSAATATRAATSAAAATATPAGGATTLPNTGGDGGAGMLIATAIALVAMGALIWTRTNADKRGQ